MLDYVTVRGSVEQLLQMCLPVCPVIRAAGAG